MKRLIVFVFLTGILFGSCCHFDDVVVPIISNCDKEAIEDETRFQQTSTNNYNITNVVLNGDCLEVTISSSGCNPDNWKMNLIGAMSLAAVSPPHVGAKIELINNEACLAVFQKTVSFNLTPLQAVGQNQIQLSVFGWNRSIVYQY